MDKVKKMCLTTPSLKSKQPTKLKYTTGMLIKRATKIAKKDIIVYKRFETRLDGRLVTPYNYFNWPKDGRCVVVPEFGVCKKGNYKLEVDEGLHAYVDMGTAESRVCFATEVIREMVIPKGTSYIIGDNQEIVALAMKIKPDARSKRKPAKASKRKLVKKSKKK